MIPRSTMKRFVRGSKVLKKQVKTGDTGFVKCLCEQENIFLKISEFPFCQVELAI